MLGITPFDILSAIRKFLSSFPCIRLCFTTEILSVKVACNWVVLHCIEFIVFNLVLVRYMKQKSIFHVFKSIFRSFQWHKDIYRVCPSLLRNQNIFASCEEGICWYSLLFVKFVWLCVVSYTICWCAHLTNNFLSLRGFLCFKNFSSSCILLSCLS